MTRHQTDVAVVGAGTAGLAAERAARQAGARTRLIDEAFRGTLCAAAGCMPSKLLIAAAHAAHGAREAPVFGVVPTGLSIDGTAVLGRVRRERDRFVAATKASFDDLPGGTCLKARARFTGPTTLALDNGDTVDAGAIVVATGARPAVPKPFQGLGDRALTTETVFELDDLPASLAVIGGGAIGLELAQAMARLGVDTALFDMAESLGIARDAQVQAALTETLGEDLALHLGVTVEAERAEGGVRIAWSGPSQGTRIVDRILVAAGRPPRLADLDPGAAGLALDDRGVPVFDPATLQCGDAPVFIAGDANAQAPILHEASNEGCVAGRNAAAYPALQPARPTPAFALTFTDPPHARLGAAPDAASVIGSASFADQGRARVENRATGLARLYAAPQDGRLTGAELFCPGAEHMAHLLIRAIQCGHTAGDLLDMPFYHPTLEEGLKPALRAICSQASTALPSDRDDGDAPGA